MKKYLIPIIFLSLGIICALTYTIIGSKIAPDGTLIEPFALIPICYLFIILSVMLSLVIFIYSKFKK